MPRILVVDDDGALAENLAEIVGRLGEAQVASTGAEALALAVKNDFDVGLVDVRLPDMGGMRLMAELHARSPLMQVVLVTGDATIDSAIEAVRGGAFAYVLKPFEPAQLLETVGRALDQAALHRDRERLRSDLERSERRHRAVVDTVPAYVVALDAGGRIVLWNRRLEEVTGRTSEEVLGRPPADLLIAEGDHVLPSRDGGERLVRWSYADVPSPEGEGRWRYALGIDVTAEREMLARTRRAERLAAVGTLAAGLAHEVRNPLNSALLQLDVLDRRFTRERVSDEVRSVAVLVRDEMKRLDRLVGDFLRFAQPRPPALQSVEIGEICHAVLSLIEPEAKDGGVEVVCDIAPSLPALAVDPEQIRQVLLNLVRNALEAMDEGGRLTVRTRAARGVQEIEVEDTGPGFRQEIPVFDAFFTTKPKGTGLGLSIVHRIVSDHDGTIRVESAPGRTCFTIALPARSDRAV